MGDNMYSKALGEKIKNALSVVFPSTGTKHENDK